MKNEEHRLNLNELYRKMFHHFYHNRQFYFFAQKVLLNLFITFGTPAMQVKGHGVA